MTVAPVSSQAQHPIPEAPAVEDRERPAFRGVAILASIPGLSRTT